MSNRSKILKVIRLWLGLLAASVQADDVSIKNKLDQTAKFRIIILSTAFDKTISVNPEETVNPIGTDLWHNAQMGIYALAPDSSTICAVRLTERDMPEAPLVFYLPQISHLGSFPLCKYENNFPCDCFGQHLSKQCIDRCFYRLTNAQVVIFNEADNTTRHSEHYRTAPHGR